MLTESLTIRVPCPLCAGTVESRVTHTRYATTADGTPMTSTTLTPSTHPCPTRSTP